MAKNKSNRNNVNAVCDCGKSDAEYSLCQEKRVGIKSCAYIKQDVGVPSYIGDPAYRAEFDLERYPQEIRGEVKKCIDNRLVGERGYYNKEEMAHIMYPPKKERIFAPVAPKKHDGAARVLKALAIVFFVVLPLLLSMAYVVYASLANDAKSEDDGYAYSSTYQSKVKLADSFSSPLYVLDETLLDGVARNTYFDNLPDAAKETLYMPAGLREEGYGLFAGRKTADNTMEYAKTTSAEGLATFDATKPTVVFCHGMQMDWGYQNDEAWDFMYHWVDAGYNVLYFRWSQFADELVPMPIEEKLWGRTTGEAKMRWRDTDGSMITDDVPNACMAEIFLAYYLDLMTRCDYSGGEIRLLGHSLGGQLACAISSLMLNKESEGLVNPAYMFDRVVLLDPYITEFKDNEYCDWLDRKVSIPKKATFVGGLTNTASIDLCADVAEQLIERGIALELIPSITGYVYGLGYILDGDETATNRFYSSATVLAYRTDWVKDTVGDFNGFHCAGRIWYAESVTSDYIMDTVMNNSTDYALSAKTPLSYIYARTGVTYKMDENMTIEVADDVVFSDNVEGAKIAGFAYEDTNADGIYNERLQARMSGVKVELYLENGAEDTFIGSQITTAAGYYSFDIPSIYANGFDRFYIKVITSGLKGYSVSTYSGADGMMTSGINPQTSTSGGIVIANRKNLQIVNIGLIKG